MSDVFEAAAGTRVANQSFRTRYRRKRFIPWCDFNLQARNALQKHVPQGSPQRFVVTENVRCGPFHLNDSVLSGL